MTKYSIIIPVHNHQSLTRQCLNVLLSEPPTRDPDECEIIVVDDASTDLTSKLLTQFQDRIQVLTHDTNSGFANSCNDGAAASSGEYLVFLNNDTIPEEGWLNGLSAYAEAHPNAAVVGSKLLYPNGTIQHAGMVICQDLFPRHIYNGFPAEHPAVNKSRHYQAVTAACTLMRCEPFMRVGGFDSSFTNGYEDVDLCLRMGEEGFEVHYCHESVLYHLEALSRNPRGAQENSNGRLFLSRWAGRVQPDDFKYYLEDGFIRVTYRPVYPLLIEISPLLAEISGQQFGSEEEQLLSIRSHQVFEYLKENTKLTLRLEEALHKDGT